MKIFNLIPQNFNLSKKLLSLMLTIFLAGIILSGIINYNIFLGYAKNEVNAQANLLISTMDSVRKYNADNVAPLLREQSEDKFIEQSVPAVVVRGVIDTLTTAYPDKYGKYLYKDAMINPTNLKDQATEEEIKIINKLSQQDKLGQVKIAQGFLMIDGENKFYTARPLKITQESCLSCHSTLEQAPRALQVLYEQGTYKANQGLGWKLNEVIGTKIVYVPAAEIYKSAHQHFGLVIGIFIAIFAGLIFLVNFWLKQYVVRPIERISKVADTVSLGDMNVNFEKQSNDEIGHLAEAFTRMKASLEIALRRLASKRGRSADGSR